jgi:hypothetical protein
MNFGLAFSIHRTQYMSMVIYSPLDLVHKQATH